MISGWPPIESSPKDDQQLGWSMPSGQTTSQVVPPRWSITVTLRTTLLLALTGLLVLDAQSANPLLGGLTGTGGPWDSQNCVERRPQFVMNAQGDQIKQGSEWECNGDGGFVKVITWQQGQKQGWYGEFDRDGFPELLGSYYQDQRHGAWQESDRWYLAGYAMPYVSAEGSYRWDRRQGSGRPTTPSTRRRPRRRL